MLRLEVDNDNPANIGFSDAQIIQVTAWLPTYFSVIEEEVKKDPRKYQNILFSTQNGEQLMLSDMLKITEDISRRTRWRLFWGRKK